MRGETSCDRLSAPDTIGHIWYLVYCDRVGGGGGAVKCQDIHDPSTVDAQPSTGTEKTHVSKEEGCYRAMMEGGWTKGRFLKT